MTTAESTFAGAGIAGVSGDEAARVLRACALQPRVQGWRDAVFSALPVEAVSSAPGPLKICIVTQDFAGPVRNGGIGTAYRYAAELLAGAGHRVTVLYALGRRSEEGAIDRWIGTLAAAGIELVPMPDPEVPSLQGYVGAVTSRAYAVYEWLRHRDFDLVHASEWRGITYYALVAKHLGIAFADTLFCIKTSSPTLWNFEGNGRLPDDPRTLITAYMERKSVELADVAISGSAYMLRWMMGNGYTLPTRAYVQPNIMPVPERKLPSGGRAPVRELVFFGRLEPRKGLHLFCDALDRLQVEAGRELSVTFLGRRAARFNSREFIGSRAARWSFPCRVIDNMGQPQALEYLAQDGRVAVMPSLLDNSPFGVYECLAYRIPFIASRVGGAPELIAAEDHGQVLFDLQPVELARLLATILAQGVPVARAAYDMEENNRHWLRWHAQLAGGMRSALISERQLRRPAPTPAPTPAPAPVVTVCIPHHDRPEFLQQALRSLERQTFRDFEIIVVDDGSRDPRSLDMLDRLEPQLAAQGGRLLRQSNRYAAAARNNAAAHARGRYLYFLDDDNVAKPEALAKLVDIAERTGADVLTSFADLFSGDAEPGPETKPIARLVLIGDDVAFGMVANGFGDTHALFRRSAFEALGGFREEFGVGKEDMELFARAVLGGYSLYHVPEALYWYRLSQRRIRERHYMESAGHYRVAQAYREVLPQCFHPLLPLLQGLVQATSLSGELSRVAFGGGRDAPGDLLAGVGPGEVLAERPLVYRAAHRLLRLELALWGRFIKWQIRTGGRILRLLRRGRKE